MYSEEQYLKNTRDSFAAGRVVGADEEQARILKALEIVAYVVLLEEDESGDIQVLEMNELIARIKGDK